MIIDPYRFGGATPPPEPGIDDYFDIVIWTGDASAPRLLSSIDMSGGGLFLPKARSSAVLGSVVYSLDGSSPQQYLMTASIGSSGISAAPVTFGASGITLTDNAWNANGVTYVAYILKRSAKVLAMATRTGNGTAGTVAHALGEISKLIWTWRTSTSNATPCLYHAGAPSANAGAFRAFQVDAYSAGDFWNSTDPTSSVFSIGTNTAVNQNAVGFVDLTIGSGPDASIVYGNYAGNGSTTGPTINTGRDPQCVLVKTTSTSFASQWRVLDQVRSPTFTGNDAVLDFSRANAESSAAQIALTGTGFSINTTDNAINRNGETYAYIAFLVPE